MHHTRKEPEATLPLEPLTLVAPQAAPRVVSQPPTLLVSSECYEGKEPEVTPPYLSGCAKEGDHPEALLPVCRASLPLLSFYLHLYFMFYLISFVSMYVPCKTVKDATLVVKGENQPLWPLRCQC